MGLALRRAQLFFVGGGSVPRVGGRQAVLGEKCSACRVAYAHLKLPLISPGFLLFVLAELDEEVFLPLASCTGRLLVDAHPRWYSSRSKTSLSLSQIFHAFCIRADFSSSSSCVVVVRVGVLPQMAIGSRYRHAICIGSLVRSLHVAILTGIGFCEVDFFFWWICDGKAFPLCVVEGPDNLPMHEKAEVSG